MFLREKKKKRISEHSKIGSPSQINEIIEICLSMLLCVGFVYTKQHRLNDGTWFRWGSFDSTIEVLGVGRSGYTRHAAMRDQSYC